MNNSPGPIPGIVGWIVTILTPFALILTAVRLLLTPAWVSVEYRMPGFPDDPYGFQLEDRLKWSRVSLDYLLNDEGIDFLADQQFDSGDPVFNARELKHMVDVKAVVSGVLTVWWSSFGFIVLVGLLSRSLGWTDAYKVGLVRGGWVAIGFVGLVLAFVVVAFGGFFVYFHKVFFAAGTWTFSFSDTLIRLFPLRFWQDAFLWIGGLAMLESLWLISMFKKR